MSEDRYDDRLFADFPAVSTEEWDEQIRRDLGDKDYDQTVLWRAPFGPTLRAYYRSEDLTSLDHLSGGGGTAAVSSGWMIRQDVAGPSLEEAREEIRAALEGGVDGIGLAIRDGENGDGRIPLLTQHDARMLLEKIPLPETFLHLDAGRASPPVLAMLLNEMERRSIPAESLRGSLAFDPIADLARSGLLAHDAFRIGRDLLDRDLPEFRVLQAGSHVFHAAGADLVQDTALAAASVAEYAARLTDEGIEARRVFDHLAVSVSVSSSFFPEIARLRALRLVIPQVIHGFLPDADAVQLPIHAVTAIRNMTRYDPHANLLRAATESASAVIGGCDVLCVRPFDLLSEHGTAFAHRLARGVQHILRHEAHLDKVADPSAGSYYVEVLTDAIARRAWDAFKEIEARGGLIAALSDGFVGSMLEKSRRRLREDVAVRRRILVGTNQYPNVSEKRLEEGHDGQQRMLDEGAAVGDIEWGGEAVSDPLCPFREAEEVEAIRLETERFARRRGRLPSVLVLPFGDPAVRSPRAHFAASFLGCGGFELHVPIGFDTAGEAVDALRGAPADVVVVAAPDHLYTPEVLHEVAAVEGVRSVGIVSKDRASDEVDFLLHRGSNLVATLRMMQEELGILAEEAR